MSFLQHLKQVFPVFFPIKSEKTAIFPEKLDLLAEKPVFVQFPCQDCQTMITIGDPVLPGDVAVTACSNCNASWTVYCPSLVIRKTKNIPSEIQDTVWSKLSEKSQ